MKTEVLHPGGIDKGNSGGCQPNLLAKKASLALDEKAKKKKGRGYYTSADSA